jgi:hypothetical protein
MPNCFAYLLSFSTTLSLTPVATKKNIKISLSLSKKFIIRLRHQWLGAKLLKKPKAKNLEALYLQSLKIEAKLSRI